MGGILRRIAMGLGILGAGCAAAEGAGGETDPGASTSTSSPDPQTSSAASSGETETSPDATGSSGDTTTTAGSETTEQATTADASTGEASTTGADYDGEPGEFVLEFDGRAYRLYVPSGYAPNAPIPIVVGFHGAGDDGANFYAVASAVGLTAGAEPANYALVIPDTKSPYDDFAIWSGNPNDDVDEMLVEMDEILDLVDDVGTHYHLDQDRLHAFGFSDGGLFTGVAGMARSERFASLTILGFGWGGAYPLVTPTRLVATQFACGQNDGFYGAAVNSQAFVAGQGHPSRMVPAPGVGHSFSGVMGVLTVGDMFAWMNQYAL